MARPRQIELAGALGHLAADKRLEILRRVGEGGSISQAAREAGVSYKAAWQALDTLSNLAGAALVERSVGGAGGGGARLTPAGQQLLRAAGELARAREQVMTRLRGRKGGAGLPGAAALGLRTSMRNQLPCEVEAIEAQGPLVRARLVLADGTPLVSRITAESAQLLQLAPGLPVLALCKATAVMVARHGQRGAGGAPSNLLAGKATRVARGELGDEVAVQLPSGLQVVGFAGPGSGLRSGSRVVLAVDESTVVIALA
ncbi:TOBE domain-containing protein [Ramlibacter tataouinensis]|uniref:Transcriptional regulator, LysR family-like protein n=1 Tax=Ramlibacter tataouinensis (strain ATCC BAA-407 / DSM 14655 / LMG 21543 / TTB310) TaxID=365046 RepID=F5Y3E6_RAMTT|nr:TOBE domain-containing protein [Ramlibacter tataouinensis]AEG92420.1 transcriptional regulator, LysR family-like protein [Ramlibacter tataouinensis TTB310]